MKERSNEKSTKLDPDSAVCGRDLWIYRMDLGQREKRFFGKRKPGAGTDAISEFQNRV